MRTFNFGVAILHREHSDSTMDATSATNMVDQGYGDGAAGGYGMIDPSYTTDAYCAETTNDGK